MTPRSARGPTGRLGDLSNEVKALRERIRRGGGPDRVAAHHEAGKLTARERIRLLLDTGEPSVEIGLLVAHDLHEGRLPAAGVVTCVGRVRGREAVVVANDATVEGGVWLPETVGKILRAQEVAMRCRVPIVYLVDSEGLRGPMHGDAFPGQYGAGRILYYAAVMRRYLGTPQFAGVMGPCLGSAAYLPALSDVIVMVEGTAFMGLGDPTLVKTAIGQTVSSEALGGARVHTEVSAVAHYKVENDPTCIELLRQLIGELPVQGPAAEYRDTTPPVRLSYELYDIVPDDHRQAYDVRAVLDCLLDGDPLEEFQADHACEMICGTGYLEGVGIGVIANARGIFRTGTGDAPHFGGLVYAESARKVAYFIEAMNRHGTPLLFVQDVSGFMVGPEAEHQGIIRAGADFVEAMATATVPKVVLTLNHASGAGYYAMAGQGFDPSFIVSLPTGRLGVAEGEDNNAGGSDSEHERQIDARFAASRGFIDEVLLPEELRPALGLLLRTALRNPGPHVGPFQIP
jgi:3-methylcrotonyl-CoA carboxylase beta subunit